jgi:hypothetical protein
MNLIQKKEGRAACAGGRSDRMNSLIDMPKGVIPNFRGLMFDGRFFSRISAVFERSPNCFQQFMRKLGEIAHRKLRFSPI